MDKQYPKIVTGIFILNSQNQILLVKSYKWPNIWAVPGGHIEWGESIAHTAVREAKEEVGLDITFEKIISVAEFINDPHFYKQKHFIAIQCLCKTTTDTVLKLDNDEIQDYQWFDLNTAINLSNLLDISKNAIKKILAQQYV